MEHAVVTDSAERLHPAPDGRPRDHQPGHGGDIRRGATITVPDLHNRALVVYNGPSQKALHTQFTAPVIVACNWGYLDWPCTDLVAADRLTVAAIVKRGQPQCRLYTRESSLPLPEGWQSRPSPGIDSGSLAVQVALELASQVLVIGADGVTGLDHSTVYSYPWHRSPPSQRIHLRHRQALIAVSQSHPGRVKVLSDQHIDGLDCRVYDQVQAWFK